MKYIDAEKLKISLSDLAEHHKYYNGDFHDGVVFAVDEMIEDITSLQQEQPVLPGIEESGIPGKDFIPVEWVDACEQYGRWKIIQQEKPEVDLEKEIDEYFKDWVQDDADSISNGGVITDKYQYATIFDCRRIARHFYELGLNARKI